MASKNVVDIKYRGILNKRDDVKVFSLTALYIPVPQSANISIHKVYTDDGSSYIHPVIKEVKATSVAPMVLIIAYLTPNKELK
jgi:hypothetical protein